VTAPPTPPTPPANGVSQWATLYNLNNSACWHPLFGQRHPATCKMLPIYDVVQSRTSSGGPPPRWSIFLDTDVIINNAVGLLRDRTHTHTRARARVRACAHILLRNSLSQLTSQTPRASHHRPIPSTRSWATKALATSRSAQHRHTALCNAQTRVHLMAAVIPTGPQSHGQTFSFASTALREQETRVCSFGVCIPLNLICFSRDVLSFFLFFLFSTKEDFF
jgi:hypothetical protein